MKSEKNRMAAAPLVRTFNPNLVAATMQAQQRARRMQPVRLTLHVLADGTFTESREDALAYDHDNHQ